MLEIPYPTVSAILDLAVVRAGKPTVVAGERGLSSSVRWVHAVEVADLGHLLAGGELVLTTGIALPDSPAALKLYVDELVDSGAVGLIVEYGRRWQEALPAALVVAANTRGFPIITLSTETRFVSISEAVAALIRDAQLAELTASERIHESFTTLTMSGAEPSAVLREVAALTGKAVVLQNLAGDVLAYDCAGHDPAEVLPNWRERGSQLTMTQRTSFDPGLGWLATVVGAKGDDWGRLVLITGAAPVHRHTVVVERAASALAVHRLISRDRASIERQAHRAVLTSLLNGTMPLDEVATRAQGLGLTVHPALVGLSLKPVTTSSNAQALASEQLLGELADAVAAGVRRLGLSALVGTTEENLVAVLLSTKPDALEYRVDQLSKEIHRSFRTHSRHPEVIIGVGSTVSRLDNAPRSLRESIHVVESVLAGPENSTPATNYRLADVRLRGLLSLLREDERLTAFIERELGPLLDPKHQRSLELLRVLCLHGGNKSAAAKAAHLSRTAYYQQLAKVEQLLAISLDEPESILSLHVALLSLECR